MFLEIGVKIIDVVSVSQKDCRLEHAIVVGIEEEALAGNEQFFHHHNELLPADAHIAENRKTRQVGLYLQEVVSLFEVATFSKLRWYFAEDVGVGCEVELYGLAERVAEDHYTAINAVDVSLN